MIDSILFGYSDRSKMTFDAFRSIQGEQRERLGLSTRKRGKGLGSRKRKKHTSKLLRSLSALSRRAEMRTIREWNDLLKGV